MQFSSHLHKKISHEQNIFYFTTYCSNQVDSLTRLSFMSKYSFTFNPDKKGLRKILGELETDIMELVWERGEATVRDIHDRLQHDRKIAYTTVMTVMSRLSDKGLLEKRKEGAAHVYRPIHSRSEFTKTTVKKVISELLSDFSSPTIAGFLDSIEEIDEQKLDELERLIEQKWREKDV